MAAAITATSQVDDEDYDDVCQICMEQRPDISMSPCSHVVCETCCVHNVVRTNKVIHQEERERRDSKKDFLECEPNA